MTLNLHCSRALWVWHDWLWPPYQPHCQPPITLFTALQTLSFVNKPSSPFSTSTPTFKLLLIIFAFKIWSPTCGKSTSWHWLINASKKEPDPQCAMKHPTDGCYKISSCWTHLPCTIPFPWTLSSNPSGKASSIDSAPKGGLSAARNGQPESSRPNTNSWNWSLFNVHSLPNAQYITDLILNLPSHLTHFSSKAEVGGFGMTGPEKKYRLPKMAFKIVNIRSFNFSTCPES